MTRFFMCTKKPISIHAPTRGATLKHIEYGTYKVFQSTLPREERPISKSDKNIAYIFQSTLPREERRIDGRQGSSASSISIHAPTRGATKVKHLSTARHIEFQSTLPREERQLFLLLCYLFCNFNPRSHERSDCHCRTICHLF